ncbi:MAG: hypothetical protein KAH23_05605, partial [Kiritimatiellae bacterium]|nr:hypothetical protein [Kiritimatiellia bacterium]
MIKKNTLYLLVLFTFLFSGATIFGQDADADASLAAEDLLLDELAEGDIPSKPKPAPVEELAAEVLKGAAPVEDLLLDELAKDDVPEEPKITEGDATKPASVEELAAEVLKGAAPAEDLLLDELAEEDIPEEPKLTESDPTNDAPVEELAAEVLKGAVPAEEEEKGVPFAEPAPVAVSAVDADDLLKDAEAPVKPAVEKPLAKPAVVSAPEVSVEPVVKLDPVVEPAPTVTVDAEKDDTDLIDEMDLDAVVQAAVKDAVLEGAPGEPPVGLDLEVVDEGIEPVVEPPVEVVPADVAVVEPVVIPSEPVVEPPVEVVPADVAVVEPVVIPSEPVVVQPPVEAPPAVVKVPAENPVADADILDAFMGDDAPDVAIPLDAPAPAAKSLDLDAPVPVPVVRSGVPKDAKDANVYFATGEEALLRKAHEQHAEQTLSEAQTALERRRLILAIHLFEEAVKAFNRVGDRPEKKHLLELAKKGLVESIYQQAVFLQKHGELEQAEQFARRASVKGHSMAPIILREIKDAKKAPPMVEPRSMVRWKAKDYKDWQREIARKILKGREYFAAGEYDKAQAEFDGVLKRDPQNTEAIRLRHKLMQRKLDRSTMELEATRKGMMAEVRAAWNPRDYGIMERTIKSRGKNRSARRRTDESNRIKILNKMESIKVPEVDFRQANIQDVIAFLQDASVEYDPEEDVTKRNGVNIILNLGVVQNGEAGAVDPADEFGDMAGDPAAPAGGEVPLITFTARYISLLEALKIVTDVAGLKYRIEGTVVIIVPVNAPDGKIDVRMYDVKPTVLERVRGINAAFGGGGGGGGAFGGGGGANPLVVQGLGQRGPWKDFFGSMGVQWPMGSSIQHIAAIGKLVVANTAQNLTVFERILEVIDVVPSQIEIEARFVEIRQTDLDSLGFEWLLTDDWEIANKKGYSDLPLSARPRVQMDGNADAG